MDDELTKIVDDEVAPLKFFDRVLSIFFSPGKVMKNIAEHPKIGAAALVVLILAGLSAVYAMDIANISLDEQTIIYIERYGADYLNLSEAMQTLTDMGALTSVTAVATVLVTPFVTAFGAALVLFILTKMSRGEARFGQFYSMYFHIYIVTYLLNLIPMLFMVMNRSSLNVLSLAAVYMPDGNVTSPKYNILTAVSVISVWEALLVFIGVKNLNGWKAGKSLIVTAVNFILCAGATAAMQIAGILVVDWSFNIMSGISIF